ncbi:MAG TPA: ATP-binding protein [Bacteroidota bacterium]
MIDQEQMTQAILNLLQNALDETERSGKITLHCRQAKDTLMVTVQDTGRGIPPDKVRKIFDLYYTTKPEGTGMGLPIAQQIITQHGGSIDVRSAEGRGTRFEITIPLTSTSQR